MARIPPPAKLIMSAMFSDVAYEVAVIQALEEEFGPLDMVSERVPFDHTDYYRGEMGPGLHRRILSWRALVAPAGWIRIKKQAESVENGFRDEHGNRKVNLDPGLMGPHHFVLTTHKGYAHRIYVGDGVYADLALVFGKGSFRSLPWTYPDYGSPPVLPLFNLLRSVYLWQLRNPSGDGFHDS
jgi:hypothetical protein